MARSNKKPTKIERGPMDQLSAHLDRGWDLVHQGDLQGARRSADQCVALDAQSPEAHNLLGYVRAALGEAEEALDAYRQALALDDTFVEAMLNAAEVMIHPIHDFEGARGMVLEALEFAENDDDAADGLLVSFDAHIHEGDTEGAARVAARLPTGPFENGRLYFLVGRAHFEVGDSTAAAGCFERALETDDGNPDLHYYRGMLLEEAKDLGAAAAAFLKTRRLDQLERPAPWSLPYEGFEEQVKLALGKLPPTFATCLEGALVVVSDLPGAELVVDGLDPRTPMALDAVSGPGEPPRAGRVYVYQRNLERNLDDPLNLPDEVAAQLLQELAAAFPDLRTELPASVREALDATERDERQLH